jgi:small subunit ribosomal protein S16
MLKLRLKRNGRKRQPSYRLVIMESASRRNGRPIDEVGYYNPITKESYFNQDKIIKWLKYGVQPTETVFQLLKKSNLIVDKKA